MTFARLIFHRTFSAPLLGALALSSVADSASAQDTAWSWRLTPYVWATDVGVDIDLDGRQVVSETIPVEDLAEDLDATFQGRLEATRGQFGVCLDVFYVAMSDDVRGLPLPQGAGQANVDWEMEMAIVDLAATFDPSGDGQGLSFLCGARVIDQRADADAEFTTSSGVSNETYEAGETLIDALVGVRLKASVTERLTLQTQVDVSAGGTELTWSAFPSLSYAFGDGGAALLAGYRHMEIAFEEAGGVESELSLSGPVLGLRMAL
jgi:hypothetical protein